MESLSGARIRSLREARDLDVAVLARKAQVSPSYIYKLEAGESPNAAAIILARVARALGTSIEYLLGITNDPRPVRSETPELGPEHLLRLQRIAEQVAHLPAERQAAVMDAFLTMLGAEDVIDELEEQRREEEQ